jgi:hypothetical protein
MTQHLGIAALKEVYQIRLLARLPLACAVKQHETEQGINRGVSGKEEGARHVIP